MSQETSQWLNTFTLIGFTEKRGHAWHYRASEQGAEPNHYPQGIPLDEVTRRLFYWKPVEGNVESHVTVIGEYGVDAYDVVDPDRKAIVRPPETFGPDDNGAILGLFKQGYQIHDYEQWLLEQVADILDDELQVSSAGLLKGGAQGWVEVSIPDTIVTPEGVRFRPNLLAATSLDGSLATTYKRTVTNTVCDNTMGMALAEDGGQLKVRHSRYSQVKLVEARAALEIVHTIADEFAQQVATLCDTTVTDSQWEQFLESLAPTTQEDGTPKEGRSFTMAATKQSELRQLWNADPRVSPWKGSAYGVVQAVNTWAHHIQTVRGSERAERNMTMTVTGAFDKLDADTITTLGEVLTAA